MVATRAMRRRAAARCVKGSIKLGRRCGLKRTSRNCTKYYMKKPKKGKMTFLAKRYGKNSSIFKRYEANCQAGYEKGHPA